jgi:histidinol phosphatase-like enzyme
MSLLPVLFLDVDGTIATLVDPASDYSDRRASWVTD